MSAIDKRCCGSGVCIINASGECWCGQVWDGEKMAHPKLEIKNISDEVSQDSFSASAHSTTKPGF